MGLLDYYRQFEDVDEEELNRERRERRHRERRLALEQVPDLVLSGTEWPDFPNSEVVNASIAMARGRVNGYPDRHAAQVRRALAEMPPGLAVCLVLRSVEGFSCEEIAEILKVPKGTVFSRLARARESFIEVYNRVARTHDVTIKPDQLDDKLGGRRPEDEGRR